MPHGNGCMPMPEGNRAGGGPKGKLVSALTALEEPAGRLDPRRQRRVRGGSGDIQRHQFFGQDLTVKTTGRGARKPAAGKEDQERKAGSPTVWSVGGPAEDRSPTMLATGRARAGAPQRMVGDVEGGLGPVSGGGFIRSSPCVMRRAAPRSRRRLWPGPLPGHRQSGKDALRRAPGSNPPPLRSGTRLEETEIGESDTSLCASPEAMPAGLASSRKFSINLFAIQHALQSYGVSCDAQADAIISEASFEEGRMPLELLDFSRALQ